jgi:cytoskeleton protein RodZ
MMDISDAVPESNQTPSPTKPTLDVGTALREAREGMGLSVHDIANRIKFAPRQVEALESNDFTHLPQTTFLRGFVRCYARVLQLDEEALIAALPVEPDKQVVEKAQSVNVTFPTARTLRRANLLWLAGALGVALLLGLFVLFQQNGDNLVKSADVVVEPVTLPASDAVISDAIVSNAVVSDVSNNEIQTSATEGEAKTPETQIKKPETQIKKPETQTKEPEVQTKEPEVQTNKVEVLAKTPETQLKAPESKAVTPEVQTKTTETKKFSEPGVTDNLVKFFQSVTSTESQIAPVSAPVSASATAAAEAEATTKAELPLEVLKRRPMHFVFDEASWAEVVDANGNLLLSRNVPRGGEKWIGGPGRAPYAVSIKNPAKVRLYYKGKQIDLSPYAAMEIAHLTVK